MAIVICAFAGLGKTFLSQKYANIIDFDIGPFKYENYCKNMEEQEKMKATPNRVRNKNYPQNYITALKKIIKLDNIVLVPADLEVRNILKDEQIDFIFIIPSIDSKCELIARYRKRGNNEMFINRAINDLENWSKVNYNYKTIILSKGKYLEDYLIEKKLI
ncbi:MAG: hypothetical protein ACLU84_02500 [Clostridia bacterium]